MFWRRLSRSLANLSLPWKWQSVPTRMHARCWSYWKFLNRPITTSCLRRDMIVNCTLLIIIWDVPDVEVITSTQIRDVAGRLTRSLPVRMPMRDVSSGTYHPMWFGIGVGTPGRGRGLENAWLLPRWSPHLWLVAREVQEVGCEIQSRRGGGESCRSFYVFFSRFSTFGWHCHGSPLPRGCGSDLARWRSDDVMGAECICSWAHDALGTMKSLFLCIIVCGRHLSHRIVIDV